MGWWGKLIGGGVGFLVGQAPGALVGVALGHLLDRQPRFAELPIQDLFRSRAQRRARIQRLFFNTTFGLMGHLAKSKGRVNEADIVGARTVMDRMGLDDARRKEAIARFTEGKSADYPLEQVLSRFRREVDNQGMSRLLLETLLEVGYADGALSPAEARLLARVRSRLDFPRAEYNRLEELVKAERRFASERGRGAHAERHSRGHGRRTSGGTPKPTRGHPPGAELYAILGVTPEATDREIQRAYRKLLSQHHPDKIMAQGLSEEAVKLAAHQTHEIKNAYERLKRLRGF